MLSNIVAYPILGPSVVPSQVIYSDYRDLNSKIQA